MSARPLSLGGRRLRLQPWWCAFTLLLVVGLFSEAVFAGAMLSGAAWAREVHSVVAPILIAASTTAAIVCLLSLRRVPHGLRLGLTLLALGVAVLLQSAIGRVSAGGGNLLWLHVPLGVALVGLAAHAFAGARRLGDEGTE